MPIASNPKGAYLGAPLVKENASEKSGTHYDFNGVGGYFGIPTLADLALIPCDPTALNEDGFSSGQRRLGMRVRVMTTADRGREFVLDVPGFEEMTRSQQIAALCSVNSFIEQPGANTPDLTGITGDITFSGSTANIGSGKVTAAKIADAIKSPAPTVEGLRRLGTGANDAAPGNSLANKVDKILGYGLSQRNYTAAEASKLALLPDNPVNSITFNGAEVGKGPNGEVSLTFDPPNVIFTPTPGSITNNLLADDIKVGSLSAAKNAYPANERAALTTVESFLVWIGPKITDLFSRVGSLDTGFGVLTAVVNGFAGRISALEARPTGTTSTGTGSGTASYPAQSPATANMYLQSTGGAGAERWAAVVNNKVGWIFNPKNELSRSQRFFKAASITRIEKDAGISTLSYSINGATAVQIVFTANVFIPATNAPLTFPTGSLVTWGVTYAGGASEGAFEVEATETNS